MIKVLVLDDNPKKLQKIRNVLLEIEDITENNIDVVTDIINAKRVLAEGVYDLLLLDIQIPNRIDQKAKTNGGLEFLNDIKRNRKRYNIPEHIIGITAYDESYLEANNEFERNLFALIKYDDTSDEWSTKISNSILHILISKNKKIISTEKYSYDLAIVCALNQVELESIFCLSDKWDEHRFVNDSTTYYTTLFETDTSKIRVVAAAAQQMGMAASAVLTMNLINNFRPKYLVMTGITAGVEGEVNLGDVIVADPSWDYGNGKIKFEEEQMVFAPDPKQLRIDSDIVSYLTTISNNKMFLEKIRTSFQGNTPETSLRIHIGPLASGAAVVADSSVIDSIKKQNRKLLGIEMETYGVLYAANNCIKPRPIAFSIKSVSDFANSRKGDNYQKYAAYTSSKILYKLVTKYLNYGNVNTDLVFETNTIH